MLRSADRRHRHREPGSGVGLVGLTARHSHRRTAMRQAADDADGFIGGRNISSGIMGLCFLAGEYGRGLTRMNFG